MNRSLKGLNIHPENKLEKLQSSKFIKWQFAQQPPTCPSPTTSAQSPETDQDTRPWHWQLALNNPSPTVWSMESTTADHPPSLPLDAHAEEMSMELEWNIIDYLLDDQESPDLAFPVEYYLPDIPTDDRGEFLLLQMCVSEEEGKPRTHKCSRG